MLAERLLSEELLEKREGRGYPAEYLLSRIRGRRTFLITDWEPFIGDTAQPESLYPSRYEGFISERSSSGIRRRLQAEYRWVYHQMERSLREVFAPFFFYSELRTLFPCLRLRASGDGARMEQILAGSLFPKGFRKALAESKDLQEMLEEVESFLMPLSEGFRGLKDVHARDGLKGVEQRLTNHYLECMMNFDLDPIMKKFFVRLVDARNVIALHKHLRWELTDIPRFIAGGSIKTSRLSGILTREDTSEAAVITRSLTGISAGTTDPAGVENALYRGTTRFLRKKGRDISGVGLILEYLWKCSLEAMNLGIIFHGRNMDRDALRAELLA